MSYIKPQKTRKNLIIEEFEKLVRLTCSKEEWNKNIFDFYYKHYSYFDKVDEVTGNYLVKRWIEIKIIIIRILDTKERYKDAQYLCTQLNILLNKLDKDYYEYQYSYIISRRWQGVILGRLKKYNASNKTFKELMNIGEETVFYKNWIVSNYTDIIRRYCLGILLIYLIVSVWTLIERLTNINMPTPPRVISSITNYAMSISIFAYFFAEKIIRYFFNKKYRKIIN